MSTKASVRHHDIEQLLARAVDAQIISAAQREQLVALADEDLTPAADVAGAATAERSARDSGRIGSSLSVITVAYGVGALLVVFACGWFLIDRWAKLGPWGVLAVALGYSAVLALAARWLRRNGFPLAADVATMLVVTLAPLVAWPFLSLSGRWPDVATGDPLARDRVWMAWQSLVLEGVLLLAALLVLRRRAIVALTWPIAAALGGAWLHLSEVLRGYNGTIDVDRWSMLAGGFAMLLVAERVERWQRRRDAAVEPTGVVAAGGTAAAPGDFANAFWVIGLAATTIAYMAIWLRLEHDPWQHLLPVLSLGLVALSLYLRRRTVLLVGVLGILGYLAFLAEDVFRHYVSFPILLAGFGILVILATVWTQTRFPALVDRLEQGRSSDEHPFPWSPAMAALPLVVALAMALAYTSSSDEARAQAEFRDRFYLLRQHSGSMAVAPSKGARPPRARGRTAEPAPAGGGTRNDSATGTTRNIPRDSS